MLAEQWRCYLNNKDVYPILANVTWAMSELPVQCWWPCRWQGRRRCGRSRRWSPAVWWSWWCLVLWPPAPPTCWWTPPEWGLSPWPPGSADTRPWPGSWQDNNRYHQGMDRHTETQRHRHRQTETEAQMEKKERKVKGQKKRKRTRMKEGKKKVRKKEKYGV